jgi:hypothetical protein
MAFLGIGKPTEAQMKRQEERQQARLKRKDTKVGKDILLGQLELEKTKVLSEAVKPTTGGTTESTSSTNTYLIIGGVAVLGVIGYFVYKKYAK